MTDISHLNSLHLPVHARNVFEVTSEDQLKGQFYNGTFNGPHLILGTGSNILFTKDYPGNIILVKIPGQKIISENSQEVFVEFGAGVIWHDIVTWAVDNNYSGLENMALIPGTVGAAAVGNIAAYGQNQEDVLESLRALNLKTCKFEVFRHRDMRYSYRDSFFKKNPEYLVTSVIYKLSKTAHLELSYRATHHASLLPTLQSIAQKPYTIKNVFDAVIKLRQEKLPDPAKIGTAGSFFKNPVVSAQKAAEIKLIIPELQTYPVDKLLYTDTKKGDVKLPAGMLLDKLGWRDKRVGNVGTYPTHALTVVAYPGATGQEVYSFAEDMRADIKKNFEIDLEYEVVIV